MVSVHLQRQEHLKALCRGSLKTAGRLLSAGRPPAADWVYEVGGFCQPQKQKLNAEVLSLTQDLLAYCE